ncbi:glutaredoxin domain-containing protein [Candidatus Neomarinimicrobiota bacterium]
MAQIELYVTSWCPYCSMARNLLHSMGLVWREINIDKEGITRADLANLTGRFTVPQIIINGRPVGGYEDLYLLSQSGKLKDILEEDPPADTSST